MEMQELKLDGNAIAGLLGEVFALEPTAGRGTCEGCGAVNAVGALHVYVHGPGVVVRCPSCESIVLRVVRARGRYLLDLRGLRVLELADPA
jgi:uncharacterized protein DUF6510